MAEERVKAKYPRPRDYWMNDAIETAKKIRDFAYHNVEDLEIDEQELQWFSDFVLLTLYEKQDRIDEIEDKTDTEYFFTHEANKEDWDD